MGSDVLSVEETFGWQQLGVKPQTLSYFKDNKATVQQLARQRLTNFLSHTKSSPKQLNRSLGGVGGIKLSG